MPFNNLKPALSSTTLFLHGLLLTLLFLPLFALSRLLLFLLYCPTEPLRQTLAPTLTLHTTAHTLFHTTWTHFLALPPLHPIKKHRIHILASTLLLTHTVLALTLFSRSATLILPWVAAAAAAAGGNSTSGEVALYLALFLGCCAPVASVAGVGIGAVYYARKVWKYGKFEKEMRRRGGGRGYWMDPSDGGEEVVRRPEAVARWQGNRGLKHGVAALRDMFQGGYDGRGVRRAAWQAEEMEMADRSGKMWEYL